MSAVSLALTSVQSHSLLREPLPLMCVIDPTESPAPRSPSHGANGTGSQSSLTPFCFSPPPFCVLCYPRAKALVQDCIMIQSFDHVFVAYVNHLVTKSVQDKERTNLLKPS